MKSDPAFLLYNFVLWRWCDYMERSIVGPKPALSFDDEMRAAGLRFDDLEDE